jgi:methylated-DNA-[protein]-cysteine S-methyltransferase
VATDFQQACYDLLLQVPTGKVTTYAEIAHALGGKAYRTVGTAMNKNPNPVIVPCHRVVNSDGRLGQYAFGCERKQQLLESEGVDIVGGKVQDFERVMFRFESVSPMIQHEGLRIFSILSQHNLIGALSSEAALSVSYKSMLDWEHKI